MIYEVNESRFFEIENIKEIISKETKIIKIKEEIEIAYFNLIIDIKYLNIDDEKCEKSLELPIEFNIRSEEEIDVMLKNLFINIVEDKGIDVDFIIDVNINELEESTKIIEEIITGEKIIDAIQTIEEQDLTIIDSAEVSVVKYVADSEFNFLKMLKNSYKKYKMIILNDESSFDKISLKYNIKIEDLFKMKKEGLKVIVSVNE